MLQAGNSEMLRPRLNLLPALLWGIVRIDGRQLRLNGNPDTGQLVLWAPLWKTGV